MSDIVRNGFGRVQRFSTEWHANTFSGSTVRKISRGMWAIDGHDVASASQASLRAQVAIVPQEPVLFHRSLAENIAHARAGASAQEQPPFPRLAWLETQLGASSGTLLERLNALEVAAKAQGLL